MLHHALMIFLFTVRKLVNHNKLIKTYSQNRASVVNAVPVQKEG